MSTRDETIAYDTDGLPQRVDVLYQRLVWQCGGENKFEVPKPEGNLWKTCVEPLLEEDRLQCEAWKDEVHNLLIFAGLFSAIVTAFVIQSCQILQPTSPNGDTHTFLLARIASALDHQASIEPLNLTPTGIRLDNRPSDSNTIRITICWFLSLILSLITVLIGIVSLQWLREFQRYPSNAAPKRILAMRTLRAEAFVHWRVAEILAGLPVLIQVALILFFGGLVEFLLSLNLGYTVAAPVTMIVVAFIFILATTFLPTVWTFRLLDAHQNHTHSTPCPYKSPQSWAFLQLYSSSMIRQALVYMRLVLSIFTLFITSPLIILLGIFRLDSWLWSIIDAFKLDPYVDRDRLHSLISWNAFDNFWLDERQRVSTRSSLPSSYFDKTVGCADYDAARGLAFIINDSPMEESTALAVYHCFQELPTEVVKEDIFDLMLHGLPDSIKQKKATRNSPSLDSPSDTMIRDENELFILARLPQTLKWDIPHAFKNRQLEVFIRTLGYLFTDVTCTGGETTPTARRLLIPFPLRSVKRFASLPSEISAVIQEQLVMIFLSFLDTVLATPVKEAEPSPTRVCFEDAMLGDFMELMKMVTLFSISSRNETSVALQSEIASSLTRVSDSCARLIEITSRERTRSVQPRHRAVLFRPKDTFRAPKNLVIRIAILYITQFDPKDLDLMAKRAPEVSVAFRSLVFATQTFEKSAGGTFQFPLHHHHYGKRWRDIIAEVVPTSTMPEPRASNTSLDARRTTTRDTETSNDFIEDDLLRPPGFLKTDKMDEGAMKPSNSPATKDSRPQHHLIFGTDPSFLSIR